MSNPRDLLLPAVSVLIFPALAWLLMGPVPLAVIGMAFVGGLALFVATLWRHPIDTTTILVPYLLTVLLFIGHVGEEYLTGFEQLVSRLGGTPVSQRDFLLLAAFLAPMVWIGGAVMILLRWRFGDFFLCLFFFAMVVSELAHFVFPFLVDGTFHYESGMYSAALPLIPAAWGLRRMLVAVRAVRN